ncbi:smg-9 homolog [Nesidiocoris tenuis]|uniref:Smg-9 homolog n=1 Tax=Nesidiocoris tenuis TaxID=355587 RepID=A0ABN7AH95_9HEMI|nr:smg-9 homolog [Nesidiocoris tenuis]
MDSERGRDPRRKKYLPKEKEKEPQKRVVILTKAKDVKADPPAFILKTRETRRGSSPPSSISRESLDSGSTYVLASKTPKPNKPQVPAPGPPVMQESLLFLNEDTIMLSDAILEYLTDSTDFLVVGCIGLQSVGKSEIMSRLARPVNADGPDSTVFQVQGKSQIDSGSYCTDGINCYINERRVIFLDVQPLLSLSLLNKYYAHEGAGLALHASHVYDPESPCLENDFEVFHIQLTALLLSICHVVLAIQDYFIEPDLIRILHIAESLKPSFSPQLDEKPVEYYPHIFFVHNKCPQSAFSSSAVKTMQDTYAAMSSHSQLLCQSNVGIANGLFIPSLGLDLCDSDPPVNLFLIPRNHEPCSHGDYIVKTFDESLDFLRDQLHCVQTLLFTHTPLSEKNWYHYAVKMWDDIKKSPMFVEYGRILPTHSSFASDP